MDVDEALPDSRPSLEESVKHSMARRQRLIKYLLQAAAVGVVVTGWIFDAIDDADLLPWLLSTVATVITVYSGRYCWRDFQDARAHRETW